jgi:hypothetical protein
MPIAIPTGMARAYLQNGQVHRARREARGEKRVRGEGGGEGERKRRGRSSEERRAFALRSCNSVS